MEGEGWRSGDCGEVQLLVRGVGEGIRAVRGTQYLCSLTSPTDNRAKPEATVVDQTQTRRRSEKAAATVQGVEVAGVMGSGGRMSEGCSTSPDANSTFQSRRLSRVPSSVKDQSTGSNKREGEEHWIHKPPKHNRPTFSQSGADACRSAGTRINAPKRFTSHVGQEVDPTKKRRGKRRFGREKEGAAAAGRSTPPKLTLALFSRGARDLSIRSFHVTTAIMKST